MKMSVVKFFSVVAASVVMTSCSQPSAENVETAESAENKTEDASLLAENEEKDGILEIGASLPMSDAKMMDVNGSEHAIVDLAKENGVLVIFSCNTCPFVIGNGTKTDGWEGRYAAIHDYAAEANIGMALINPNEAKRSEGDGMDDMKKRYADQKLKGAYLLDQNHQLADAFGALTTPHVFLFDADMKLIYRGAIDDNVDRAAEVKVPYLMNAIDAHVAGETIEPNSTRQLGCSIKRVKA